MISSIQKKIANKLRYRFGVLVFNSLKNILSEKKIDFVDIGASNDFHEIWKPILPLVNYFGFEPDDRLIIREDNSRIYNYGLWHENTKVNFNINQKEETSSIYNSNHEFLERFPNSQRFKTINKEKW